MAEQLEVLTLVANRLNRAGIPYMISGSVAMAFHATPRMTRDIDIVIELGDESADRLVDAFEADFYVDAEAVSAAIAGSGMFNLLHDDTLVKVDFIVRKNDAYRALDWRYLERWAERLDVAEPLRRSRP